MCSKIGFKLKAVTAIAVSAALIIAVTVSAKRNKVSFVLPDTSTAETGTNRYVMYKNAEVCAENRLSTDGYVKKLENSSVALWVSEENGSLRAVDKKSGRVWGSLVGENDSNLNDMWNALAKSAVTIEYYDELNTSYRVSLSDSQVEKSYTVQDDRLIIEMNCTDIGISLSFGIELKDGGFEFYVVKGSLKEESNNKIARLYLIPFFGSTLKAEMDGYFFVPDGSGALIRFDADTDYETPYSAKIYGRDVGIDQANDVTDLLAKRPNDYLVDSFDASVPVYGVVHGNEQYAAMTVVEDSEEYAVIEAQLAGQVIPYNRITAYFEYRQMYNQPVSKTNSIYQPQAKPNDITPRISVYLLSGDDASYNGMALKYRSVLEENGTLSKNTSEKQDIPLRLEVVAAEIKSGFLFHSTNTLTTVKQTEQICSDLSKNGIDNLTLVLSGWQKGGLNGGSYGSFSLQKSVGSRAEIKKLRDSVTADGGKFYMQTNAVTMNKSQGRLSYLANTAISKELSHYYRDNSDAMFPETYVISPTVTEKTLKTAKEKLEGFSLNLPGVGSELCSDYKQNRVTTRSSTKSLFCETAAALSEDGTQLSFHTPNVYLWKSCSDYFDIPMMNSQYTMETDSVPFLQMLLKGYVPYYAPYANQGFYRTNCILRTVEYGAYPSFIVMNADNSELTDTPLVDYFSLNYGDWSAIIADTYSRVNSVLKEVENACILQHKTVADSVVRVRYDNGVVIYVNYNSYDVEADGVTVPGLNFVLERG